MMRRIFWFWQLGCGAVLFLEILKIGKIPFSSASACGSLGSLSAVLRQPGGPSQPAGDSGRPPSRSGAAGGAGFGIAAPGLRAGRAGGLHLQTWPRAFPATLRAQRRRPFGARRPLRARAGLTVAHSHRGASGIAFCATQPRAANGAGPRPRMRLLRSQAPAKYPS